MVGERACTDKRKTNFIKNYILVGGIVIVYTFACADVLPFSLLVCTVFCNEKKNQPALQQSYSNVIF